MLSWIKKALTLKQMTKISSLNWAVVFRLMRITATTITLLQQAQQLMLKPMTAQSSAAHG